MSKRKLAWIALALTGALAAAGLLYSMVGTTKLVLTEPQLQARLNQQLPKTVRDVTIERVAVHLADNRLALRIDIQGTVLRQSVSAVVAARGVPRYEAQGGELYFDADEVRIGQLTIAGRNVLGDEERGQRGRAAEATGSAVQRLAEAAIKAYLATRPVYRFKDDFKGFVLKAALVDVAIEQNALVVTLSLWNLTVAAATWALLFLGVLVLIYLLVSRPHWGTITDAVDI
jgi:hypothetical protein